MLTRPVDSTCNLRRQINLFGADQISVEREAKYL